MTRQFAKDPEEVLDYPWPVPLDAGDAISAFTAVRVSGDVVLDSTSHTDSIGTIWLSGGTDGTASVFTLTAETDAGRIFETAVVISVVDAASASVAEFLIRYPAFAAVSVAVITYWIKDAEQIVGDLCGSTYRDRAVFALAAHNLAASGYGSSAGDAGGLANSGVTSFKSASMSVQFSSEVIGQKASGGYNSTPYGREYLLYRRQSGCYAMPFLAGKCC